ncbi:Hypothetical predicted protein [Mytilus galloprovincialis]|uniref:Uncharacterized protein n=1 Tax=Mytilus galloprovincialis TaxID=29158 RepID=A0A8B6F5S5_MYTGA|nr:Hypothetical predicted protein [Mytilus galloprovincialis]
MDTSLQKTPGNYILHDNTSPDMIFGFLNTRYEESPVIYIAAQMLTSAASDSDVHMDTSVRKTPENDILQDNTSPAVQHRITDNTKGALHPQTDIWSIHNEAFIPNHDDYEALIKRALVEFVPTLKDSQDLVEFHIQHPYKELSTKKSNVESYNLLYKGSSSGEKETLFQTRNQLDRRGVISEVLTPINQSHMLAAQQILGLTKKDDFETKVGQDDIQKKYFLDKLANDIVAKFVATKEFKFDQLGKDQQKHDNNIQLAFIVQKVETFLVTKPWNMRSKDALDSLHGNMTSSFHATTYYIVIRKD